MDTNEMREVLRKAMTAANKAQGALESAVQAAAEADHLFKLRYSQEWLRAKVEAPDRATVAELEARTLLAKVEEGCTVEDLRHAANLAEGMEKAANARVRGTQQNLSAVQSLAGLYKAELQSLGYGQQGAA